MRIEEIRADELDHDQLTSIAQLLTDAHHVLDPTDPPFTTAAARNELHPGDRLAERLRVLATIDDRAVGLASVELEHRENRNVVDVLVLVHPDFTRRGVGTALVRRAVEIGQQNDRESFVAWGIRNEASKSFWAKLKLPEVSVARMSRVRVADVDRNLMEKWRNECSAKRNGYRLVGFTGTCPEELLPTYIAAELGMHDAPLDDMEIEHEVFDEERIRLRTESFERRNMKMVTLFAVAPDGSPAGMTEVNVFADRLWFVQQQGTTTLAEHRGQGIGRWLKAEMFDKIVHEYPEATVIDTGNASTNTSMLSINNEMGFELYGELTIRQAPLADLDATLTELSS